MQSQPNRQVPSSYNGALPRTVYPPAGVPPVDSMTPGFIQSAAPYYNATTNGQHGPIPLPTGPGIERRSGVYGGNPISEYGFNDHMARSREAPAPQPHDHGGYMMPGVQYDNPGQGSNNYAGYDFTANQFLDPTGFLSPLLPGAYTVPNNQGSFPVWRLSSGWVSYAVEDEVHVTIALRRIRVPPA